MVAFRGILKLKQRSHKSPLGVKFKFSDDQPVPFHMGAAPGFQMSNVKWRSEGVKEWWSEGAKEWWSEIVPPLQLWKICFEVKKGGKYSGATQSLWPSARAWFFLLYLQRSFFVCSISVICSRHLLFATLVFICSVLFLFAAYFFYLQRTFFICSVSFLFAAFLFCLQRVPCGPS